MDVSLMYCDGCPSYETTLEDLSSIADEIGWDGTIDMILIGSDEEAARTGFRGSPTVLVNGIDPFFDADAPLGLACRLYVTESGLRGTPSRSMLLEALRSATS